VNFIQPNFFIFLFVFVCAYRIFGQRARVSLGIFFSFYFYAYFSPAYSLLLLVSSVIDYLAGAAIYKSEKIRTRRWWLSLSLVSNLGLLVTFKYSAFLWNSFASVAEGLESMASQAPPMGISFFTFQTLSYTIDIYRGELQPCRSIRKFLFFISFFPQLVAGPIVRARDFLPQIEEAGLRWDEFKPCCWRFLRGFAKKACLADALGVLIVDPVYNNIQSASPVTCALAVMAYGLQLYLDFSGYSDMAIALGRLLGYTFPENFNYPYLARSFSEFWKRWHISLSSWLRDYLYISLGGNRQGTARTLTNLMLTMLLGGLWHGAGWNFVVWGGLNGGYLALEHLSGFPQRFGQKSWAHALGRIWVVGGYFFSLIFFRASTFDDACAVIQKIYAITWLECSAWWSGQIYFSQWQVLILLSLAASTHIIHQFNGLRKIFAASPMEVKSFFYVFLGFALLHFYPSGRVSAFIYFQF
jgi:alginate O-acetyltransferase complex protein AlgI